MLAKLGGDAPSRSGSESGAAGRLRAFEIILVLHLVTSTFWWAAGGWWLPTGDFSWIDGPMIATLCVTAALAAGCLHPTWRTIALPGMAVLQATVVIGAFPETANHSYLEFAFVGLVAFFQPRSDEERRLLLGALRWVTIVVFFSAGVQKLAHGYYFGGEFLAFQLTHPGFGPALSWLVPAEEVARIAGYAEVAGDGPYRVASLPLVLLSNAACLWELVVAVLLAFQRTRFPAVLLCAVFLAVTEVMAREFFFGVLFLNALLLFLRTEFNRRLIGVFVAFDVWVMLVKLELLPAVITF